MKLLVFFIVFKICDLVNSSETNKGLSSKLDLRESRESKEIEIEEKSFKANNNSFSPKIQGVQITVDTGKSGSKTVDSKESVEIIEGKNKNRIGIHTDITFEIDTDKSSTNSTENFNKNNNDDTVPIFKGREATLHHPVYSRYEPRASYHPRINNVDIYRSIDNWANFVPITSSWTTEKSFYNPYQPLATGSVRDHTVKYIPNRCKQCICTGYGYDRVQRRSHQLNDKLDTPFSRN